MLYHSTRSLTHPVDSAQAVLEGLAPDGGLFVPEKIPYLNINICLAENTMKMATRIISAMLPEIADMPALVEKAYRGKFQKQNPYPL